MANTTEPIADEPHRDAPRRIRFVRGALFGLLSFALVAAVACGNDDDGGSPPDSSSASDVAVALSDGAIDLDSGQSADGDLRFTIENVGDLEHEFVVVQTDLGADELPLTDDGAAVDESGSGVSTVAKRGAISPGTTVELEVDSLEPGDYVFICNVPGHYELGMHAAFTVR